MDINLELNKKQKEAVLHDDGPALVLSGAGSGKTRVITYRTAYLLEKGVNPNSILTVTFTNKAADEMQNRINELTKGEYKNLNVSTFHAACLKILRENLDLIGYSRNYLIASQSEQVTLTQRIIKSFDLDTSAYNPRDIHAEITNAKINLIDPFNYVEEKSKNSFGLDNTSYHQTIADIYEKYNETLREDNTFDFADLIAEVIYLFRDYPYVLKDYQNKYKYIQVDEYQDTNRAQYLITKMLAEPENNLFVVGDFDQSIYKFRGADINNILDFEKDFPEARTVRLERNYRSTQNIIKASNNVIENNSERLEKTAYTNKDTGMPVVICEADTSYGEASFVADAIERITNYDHNYGDITILYRTNFQSRNFESTFMKRKIPYEIINDLDFFQRSEVKNFMAYLKLLVNIDSSLALNRIVNFTSNGIGPKTMASLQLEAEEKHISLIDVMENPESVYGVGKIKGKAIKGFLEKHIRPLEEVKSADRSLLDKAYMVYDMVGFSSTIDKLYDNPAERDENLSELFRIISDYQDENGKDSSFQDFLNNIQLKSEQDTIDDDSEKVKLMTVHSAKGLEFPVVFVVGLEEGLLPHSMSLDEGEVEEERRLMYVAMTRAEERLFITHCNARFRYYQFQNMEPSRFLDEIPHIYTKKIEYGQQGVA